MDRRIVGHGQPCRARGVGDVGGGELVDRHFGLRDMYVCTGSGVLRPMSAASAAIAVILAAT